MMKTLLTIGAGNMARALLTLMRSGLSEFYAFTPSETRARELANDLNGKFLSADELKTIIPPDFLFLSFKPQVFKEASENFIKQIPWDKWKDHTVIVSLLAGTPIEVLTKTWKSERVIRIMPNTPSMVGHGITLVTATDGLNDKDDIKELEKLLSLAGVVYRCHSEEQLDQITSVTGSGPAYIFEITRILQDFLIGKSVPEEKARELAISLLLGSSEMMRSSSESLEQLRENVTSKKGVTLAALESLKGDNLENSLVKALESNISRSQELRQEALDVK